MDALYEQVKDMKGGLCTDLETEEEEQECGKPPIHIEEDTESKVDDVYSSYHGKGKGSEFD